MTSTHLLHSVDSTRTTARALRRQHRLNRSQQNCFKRRRRRKRKSGTTAPGAISMQMARGIIMLKNNICVRCKQRVDITNDDWLVSDCVHCRTESMATCDRCLRLACRSTGAMETTTTTRVPLSLSQKIMLLLAATIVISVMGASGDDKSSAEDNWNVREEYGSSQRSGSEQFASRRNGSVWRLEPQARGVLVASGTGKSKGRDKGGSERQKQIESGRTRITLYFIES